MFDDSGATVDPVAAFLPDIRNATNELVVQICVKSDPFGSLGGSTFTRMGNV